MLSGCIAAFGVIYNIIIYGEFTTLLVDRSTPESALPSMSTSLISLFGGGEVL